MCAVSLQCWLAHRGSVMRCFLDYILQGQDRLCVNSRVLNRQQSTELPPESLLYTQQWSRACVRACVRGGGMETLNAGAVNPGKLSFFSFSTLFSPLIKLFALELVLRAACDAAWNISQILWIISRSSPKAFRIAGEKFSKLVSICRIEVSLWIFFFLLPSCRYPFIGVCAPLATSHCHVWLNLCQVHSKEKWNCGISPAVAVSYSFEIKMWAKSARLNQAWSHFLCFTLLTLRLFSWACILKLRLAESLYYLTSCKTVFKSFPTLKF